MNAIVYYLALPFIYLVSYLPRRVMYLLSDFIYIFVYKIFGYRKNIVTQNLRNSFPEKSAAEIDKIRREYYHYFCDLSLETLKTLTIPSSAVDKYFEYGDMSVFERFHKENRSIVIVMGHLGNWELAGAYFSQMSFHQLYVIYHPLANKHFDGLFYRMRSRHGTKLYPMKDTFKGMVKNRKEVTATAFIADQTPPPGNAYWMTFLNQDTAVFRGTGTIAKKLDYPIIYISVIRKKRGLYRFQCELLVEHPGELSENEITEMHTKRLERDIVNQPETWLWSHRRWKHKRPAEQPNNN
jgi:KDO2-lipid IV(A) lauroyltransferase